MGGCSTILKLLVVVLQGVLLTMSKAQLVPEMAGSARGFNGRAEYFIW